jgi:hypothetical protein
LSFLPLAVIVISCCHIILANIKQNPVEHRDDADLRKEGPWRVERLKSLYPNGCSRRISSPTAKAYEAHIVILGVLLEELYPSMVLAGDPEKKQEVKERWTEESKGRNGRRNRERETKEE